MYQKIIMAVLVASVLALTYISGRTAGAAAGEREATEKYAKHIEQYKEVLAKQTETVNKVLDAKTIDLTKEVSALLTDTKQIRIALKNQPQPLVLHQNGDCIAAPIAVEARRKIIERVNK